MTVSELMSCARPLLFENEDDYVYSLGGTCFSVEYRGSYYVLTAKHCLAGWNPKQVRVEFEEGSERFLPFRRMLEPQCPHPEDNDYCDFLFFEIAKDKMNSRELDALNAVDLEMLMRHHLVLVAGQTMLGLKGYPFELSTIDYDRQKIARGAYLIDGTYQGGAIDSHCCVMNFSRDAQVANFNGLSGSPIFKFERVGPHYDYHLAGMLIRGSKESGIGRFISAHVIFGAVLKFQSLNDDVAI